MNEITFPYNFIITYTDGEQISADTPMSLAAATHFAESMVKENLSSVEAIEIVDNYTGELVYSIKANIRIDVDIEVYNPYSA